MRNFSKLKESNEEIQKLKNIKLKKQKSAVQTLDNSNDAQEIIEIQFECL